MLSAIKQFFQDNLQPESSQPFNPHQLHLACAALMIEIATIDDDFDQRELDTLTRQLGAMFDDIASEELRALVQLAETEHKASTSLYEFTRLINDHCEPTQKFELLTAMWRVARADGTIDKYEDYMIRRVAELINLSHRDFIRAKQLSENNN